MSYVVLARRYRPQILDQIIGQEHISRTLKNAIAENRVAHAYMFSGPRGVGKTTTARILAKALNCKDLQNMEPCGKCINCQEITAGSSIDVQEIDGASNRGIDEIRALRDNVKFAPAASKYKIYIIDEAHQITDAAFNALLKTLEEPPSHVVFILATTEPQKIPVTILSRCQRYRFRLLSNAEIYSSLERILKIDGCEVEVAALQMITSSAGGSMRDALSLTDQAISFVADKKITLKNIQDLLGFLPKELINTAVESFYKNDSSQILALIKNITEQGYNLLQFGRDLRDHLRYILLFKTNPSILEITEEEIKNLESQKMFFTQAWIIRSWHLLSKAIDEMRWSDQPRLVLELYMIKIAQPYIAVNELIDRLEKLEKNIPEADETVSKAPSKVIYESRPAAVTTTVAEPKSKSIAAIWEESLLEMKKRHPMIGSLLTDVLFQGQMDNSLLVTVKNTFQLEGLRRSQSFLEEVIEKKTGKKLGLKITLINEKKEQIPKIEKEDVAVVEEKNISSPSKDISDGIPPGLEQIADMFPGKIIKKPLKI